MMLSTVEVQEGVKKFTPVTVFAVSLILLGALVKKFDPEEENVVIGKDFQCSEIPNLNWTSNNFSQVGKNVIPYAGLAAISFVLPLVPLVLPVLSSGLLQQPEATVEIDREAVRQDLKKIAFRFVLQLFVGQSVCYGSTEVARHLILRPDLTFFEKCKLPRNTCELLETIGLIVHSVGLKKKESPSNVTALCQNSSMEHSEILDSLHSLPNTSSAMVGSSIVMFLVGMWMRRKINAYVGQEIAARRKREREIGETPPSDSVSTEERRKVLVERVLRESNPYIKIGILLLCICLLIVLLVDRYSDKRNSSIEIVGSLMCGIVIQCLVNVFYALKINFFD